MSKFEETRVTTRVTFTSGSLTLEGAFHRGTSDLAAVVMHPHPLYGGDMHNHVVAALCAELAATGASTLRFNFRGVERSEGSFDDGRGEADDARAAAAFVRITAEVHSMVLAGYSFGAGVAAAIADDAEPDALVLVSPPVRQAALSTAPGRPTLIVTGDRDQIAPAAELARFEGPDCRVVAIPGADHSWWPGIDELRAHVAGFLRSLVPE